MTAILQAQGIGKHFPGVQALDNVSLSVLPKEILAVVGENGAGKSTLMKILGGVQRPDTGSIRLDGQVTTIGSVKEAERLGIALIHQELNLVDHLDVAGNIFLGREPARFGPLRLVAPEIYDNAKIIMRRLGLECSPRTLAGNLPVGQQQLVEIARALSLKSRILILDEPTSSLTERETARLFDVLRDLRQDGISVIYISHRLKEVEEIADRVTVLRDGRNAGDLPRADIGHEAIVRLMVGRELKQFFQRSRHAGRTSSAPILQVRDLRWSRSQKQGISFELRPGEIVGMAGLMGAGRTEVAQTLFGIRPLLTGTITVASNPRAIRRPGQAIKSGIFLVPEDRRFQGLVLSASVKFNISLASMKLVSILGLIQAGKDVALAQTMSKRLNVKTPSIQQRVGLLSGGNQQKVVLAKWLCRTPRVLILDEPTRGIDVGAKSEIYALMDGLAQEGMAVLMISSDLEEILGMSDRVLVMHEGRLAGELGRADLSEEAVMHLATGGQ
jgi:ribose transport system ATP-binding protein